MQYSLETNIELPNTVVRILRPKLTEEERNRRIERIKNAAANLLIGALK